MRIGIDARLWSQTGVGRYIRNLVEHILEIDTKNEYVMFIDDANYDEVKSQKSKVKNTSKNVKFVVTDIRWHSIQEQIFFPQILNRENLDLMHFTYFSVPIFYRKPYVVTIHDLIINHFPTGRATRLPIPIYYAKRAGYKYILSHAIKHAKQVIVPLNAVKTDLIKTYKSAQDKTVVTCEGADEFVNMKKAVMPDVSYKYFLYAGNAYPHKNLDNLIKGFQIISETKKDIKLVLAGKEDYFYKKLQERINNDNLSNVEFIFNLSDEELAGYYKNAEAYCSPSRMEGFGLTPIEAAASGAILVLSDIPAFKEIWNGNAIYFDPENPSDIAVKLESVFTMDVKDKTKVVNANLEKVKKFKWRDTAIRTVKTYEDSVSL